MSRNTKIILVIIGLVVVCCLVAAIAGILIFQRAGALVSEAFVTDPAKLEETAANIADIYETEFKPQGGMSLFGVDMVFYARGQMTSGGDTLVAILMQFPGNNEITQEEMEAQLRPALEQQFGRRGFEVTQTSQVNTVIRGQDVVATISEGRTQDGSAFRQYLAPFEGKKGMAMLMIMGSPSNWDQDAVDAFIRSIR